MVARTDSRAQRVRGAVWRVGPELVVLTSGGKTLCTCERGLHDQPCEHAEAVRRAWAAELAAQARDGR